MRRLSFLVLALFVIFCGLFSVSAYAAKVEQISYNGVVLPSLPAEVASYKAHYISVCDGEYYYDYSNGVSKIKLDENGGLTLPDYKLAEGQWVKVEGLYISVIPIWTNTTIYEADGTTVFLAPSDPVVTWVETPVGTSDLEPFFQSFSDQINVPLVIGVLAGLAGVSVVLVFMWWGVRKVSGSLMKAFKKGKIRI